jgi:hypothetical protein
MNRKLFKLATLVAFLTATVVFTDCKVRKPVTLDQKEAAGQLRVKREKDECQKLAVADSKMWRAVGIAISPNERHSHNSANADAVSNLQKELLSAIEGYLKNYDDQNQSNKAIEFAGKSEEEQTIYIKGLLTFNEICSNTYAETDGNLTTYVCIELSDGSINRIGKKLSEDQKLAIDFDEYKFRQEMEQARERWRKELQQQ